MTCVLLVPGSTRDGALHTAALRTAARFAPPEITTTLYDGLRALPAFAPGEEPPAEVVALRELIVAADAILFSTPEYAGSLPGSLKNLLDWLVDGGDLVGKPVAWLSVVGPGRDDGARAALESVLKHGDARVMPSACVRIPLEMASVDEAGLVTDGRLHVALGDMLHVLIQAMVEEKPKQPAWQVHSSVYPVVVQRGARPGSAYQGPSGQSAPEWLT